MLTPIIIKKIAELVSAEIVEIGDAQKAVSHFVKYTVVWEKFTVEYFHVKIVHVKILSSFRAADENFLTLN